MNKSKTRFALVSSAMVLVLLSSVYLLTDRVFAESARQGLPPVIISFECDDVCCSGDILGYLYKLSIEELQLRFEGELSAFYFEMNGETYRVYRFVITDEYALHIHGREFEQHGLAPFSICCPNGHVALMSIVVTHTIRTSLLPFTCIGITNTRFYQCLRCWQTFSSTIQRAGCGTACIVLQ